MTHPEQPTGKNELAIMTVGGAHAPSESAEFKVECLEIGSDITEMASDVAQVIGTGVTRVTERMHASKSPAIKRVGKAASDNPQEVRQVIIEEATVFLHGLMRRIFAARMQGGSY